ncbi:MAG: hypothetical protein ACREOU_13140 [Candidatus Eiseniibacteriota bacterium]
MTRQRLLFGLAFAALVSAVFAAPVVVGMLDTWSRSYSAWQREREEARLRDVRLGPPRPLPLRQEDYARYPLESFQFVLETGDGFAVDTHRGIVTKDLVAAPDTTITLVLTASEKERIWRKVISVRLFEMPELHAEIRTEPISPCTSVRFEVAAGAEKRAFFWDTCTFPDVPSDEWKRLAEVVRLIDETVRARPEWQLLPPPTGGYM